MGATKLRTTRFLKKKLAYFIQVISLRNVAYFNQVIFLNPFKSKMNPKMTSLVVWYTGNESSRYHTAFMIIHFNIIIYAFCYWLNQPVFPFLSKSLGINTIQLGYLQSATSFFQLIGGPFIGRLCDTRGPRLAMLISQCAAMMTAILLSYATSSMWLLASQVPTLGLHCMHAAQAAITNLSPAENRVASLGRLSLSYGIGMVLGSAGGGYLAAATSFSTVAACAALCSAMTIPINVLYFPNEIKENKKEVEGTSTSSGLNSMNAIFKLLALPSLRRILVLQILVGVALSIQRSSFSQVLQLRFNLTVQDIGATMAIAAMVSIASNILIVPLLSKRLGNEKALSCAMVALSIGFGLYSMVSSLSFLLILCVSLSMVSSLFYTLVSSEMTMAVSKDKTGIIKKFIIYFFMNVF